jgi:hypothetical protein
MVSIRRAAVAALAALLPAALLGAQARELPLKLAPRPTETAITAADLMTRLYQVADDSMGGRPTGSNGHAMATAYIAAEAARLGLRPAGDNGTYFQDLPMSRRGFVAGGVVTLGASRWTLGTDFGALVARGANPRTSHGTEVIVGGTYGDTSTYITAEQAAGKVVVLRAGTRIPMNLRALTFGADSRFAGATAVVLPLWDAFPAPTRRQLGNSTVAMRAAGPTIDLPATLIASNAMVEALIAGAGQSGMLMYRFTDTPVVARNVVAVLPGSDAGLRGQYVALGAHNDHDPTLSAPIDHDSARAMFALRAKLSASLPAGTRPTAQQIAELRVNVDSLRALRAARPDSIKNGADDDGSGTVALLELAEAFAGAREKPKRSLLFVWHAAEELGLLGAAYYTDHPTVPMDSIVTQLNLDMVGRGAAGDLPNGGARYVQLVGSRRLSKELGDLVEAVNARRSAPFVFDYGLDADGHPERIYCRSDHAMYARYGVPVTFFTTGLHLDYHQITDEPQYIEYEKMMELTSFIRDVTLEVANRADRVRLDGPKPDPTAACRQ